MDRRPDEDAVELATVDDVGGHRNESRAGLWKRLAIGGVVVAIVAVGLVAMTSGGDGGRAHTTPSGPRGS